jgi:hypothetical protein
MCESALVRRQHSVQSEVVLRCCSIAVSTSLRAETSAERRLRGIARRVASCVSAIALAGCLGGQTGTEENRGETAGDSRADQCVDRITVLGIDATSPLGFSAREALSRALGQHSVALAWRAPDASFSFGPENGEGSLSLSLLSTATQARFIHGEPKPNATPLAVSCPADEIQIDATAHLETGGGALFERFPVKLRAVSVAALKFGVDLRLETLTGSFYVSPPAGASTDTLSVEVQIDDSGLHGALRGGFEQTVGEATSFRRVLYACFPPSAVNCMEL